MGAEQDDYWNFGGGGGGDYGGGADFILDMGGGGGGDVFVPDIGDADFFYGYGTGGGIDVGSGYLYDPVADQFYDMGGNFDTGGDQWRQIYDDWRAFGVDPDTAAQLADQDLQALKESQGVINISQSAPEYGAPVATDLPNAGLPDLPFITNYNPWESPPYVPTFPEPPAPPPPGPRLPGYCPAGTYHPVEDPYSCVPFPPASQQTQQPRSAAQQPTSRPLPRPQQQPQQAPCPALTHWRNPRTGKCEPKPKCPAPSVFDPQRGICVLPNQMTVPPEPGSDASAGGSKNNWWLLLLAAGAIAFASQGSGDSEYTPRRRPRR